jgi:hypothetical protein
MKNNLAILFASATHALNVALVAGYQHAQIPIATLSFGLFATSFTAMSTLTRIKDKLYDDKEYHSRVRRLRAIDKGLVEYKPYSELERSFLFMRWFCLASGIVNVAFGMWINCWTSIVGFAIFGILLFRTARVVWFFHINLAEITRIDQEKLDENRIKEAEAARLRPKSYISLEP